MTFWYVFAPCQSDGPTDSPLLRKHVHAAVAGCPNAGDGSISHLALAQYAKTLSTSNHVGLRLGEGLGMAQLACGGAVGAAASDA